MPDAPPPIDPDDRPVFEALLAAGVAPELAYTALQSLRNMAAANLIARFESKLDAQNARLDAQKALFASKLDAQDTKLKMLMWMIGAAVAVLGVLVRLWG